MKEIGKEMKEIGKDTKNFDKGFTSLGKDFKGFTGKQKLQQIENERITMAVPNGDLYICLKSRNINEDIAVLADPKTGVLKNVKDGRVVENIFVSKIDNNLKEYGILEFPEAQITVLKRGIFHLFKIDPNKLKIQFTKTAKKEKKEEPKKLIVIE
jgi:hypothetical protein